LQRCSNNYDLVAIILSFRGKKVTKRFIKQRLSSKKVFISIARWFDISDSIARNIAIDDIEIDE
jgi:hypothetical protein